jgi:hypothetical protein
MNVVKIVTHHDKPQRAADLFAMEGLVAVGFDVGDPKGKSRDELKRLFVQVWKVSDAKAAHSAGELLRFRDEIGIGDIVLAYKPPNMIALVGEVVGPPQYETKNAIGDPKGEIRYPNQRKVEWWPEPRDFHRDYLPEDLRDKVALPGTIHIFEYDFDKLKRSLGTVPPEESRQKVLEIEDEDEIKDYLEKNPEDVEKGLVIVKREHELPVGSVDFLAKDSRGVHALIEVKVKADDSAAGQILGYLQSYKEEESAQKEIRGMVVAEEFTDRCKKALKSSNVVLYRCRKRFEFTPIDC